jgi:hypothetical protein
MMSTAAERTTSSCRFVDSWPAGRATTWSHAAMWRAATVITGRVASSLWLLIITRRHSGIGHAAPGPWVIGTI